MRCDYLLHPPRPPVPPLHAATVLLVRPTPDGAWEVLMTRRSDQASFVPGAYVFPGGGVEAQDSEALPQVLARSEMPSAERVTAIAAAREAWEEMGVLLAAHADGRPASQDDIARLDRQAPLWPQLQQHGLQLDVRGMWWLAHWTADRSLPKRFAVPFWVVRMPEQQQPVADESEQFEPVWVRPQQALEHHRAQRMPMIFPTVRTLERLAGYASIEALLEAVAQGPLWHSTPRSGMLGGMEQRFMESDAPYGELALVAPDGHCGHVLDWQSSQPVALARHIVRLTAPNGGVMTGPGTNSYVVGEVATGFAVIDPGPADAAHVQRLWEAAHGDVRALVCTHSHPDHAPGAALLQRLCVERGAVRPPIYGLPSAPTARDDSRFQPDRALPHGACITLQGEGARHTLQAVFTPGHAANHLCLWLREDACVFTGDHILNGSTTIVAGPDGNMSDYLHSLDTLAALCAAQGIAFFLPAHGHVLHEPANVVARLKAHRLAREAKVLAALRALPHGRVSDWVALAYADTPQALWPLAERSLLAHVERLGALGLHHVSDRTSLEHR